MIPIGTKVVVLPSLMELQRDGRSYGGNFLLEPGMSGVVDKVPSTSPGMTRVIFNERTCLVLNAHLRMVGVCGQCDDGVPEPDDYLCEVCRHAQ